MSSKSAVFFLTAKGRTQKISSKILDSSSKYNPKYIYDLDGELFIIIIKCISDLYGELFFNIFVKMSGKSLTGKIKYNT